MQIKSNLTTVLDFNADAKVFKFTFNSVLESSFLKTLNQMVSKHSVKTWLELTIF